MNSPKVSIIIPIYNTERYLENSLQSIRQQTLNDIEIIVVNDGSTDSSLDIMEKIASQDSRIQIITTKNNGISIARNIGLFKATGEYIYFFDSDDLLDLSTLETCYQKCQSQDLDFCFFDGLIFDNIHHKIYHPSFYLRSGNFDETKIYSGKEILNTQIKEQGYRSQVCLNFIKRKFIEDINLTFYPRIIHEDELFTFLLYLKANRVGCINKPFFHRRIRNHSTMTLSYSMNNTIGYLTICREFTFYMDQYKKKDLEYKLLQYRLNFLAFLAYYLTKENLSYADTKMVSQTIIKEFKTFLNWIFLIKLKYPTIHQTISKLKSLL